MLQFLGRGWSLSTISAFTSKLDKIYLQLNLIFLTNPMYDLCTFLSSVSNFTKRTLLNSFLAPQSFVAFPIISISWINAGLAHLLYKDLNSALVPHFHHALHCFSISASFTSCLFFLHPLGFFTEKNTWGGGGKKSLRKLNKINNISVANACFLICI